jgi:hypothetical protein
MVVKIRPRPKPAKMLPTNAKTEVVRKKNPTPNPISKPPPVAHVLLSSFLSEFSIGLTSFLIRILILSRRVREGPEKDQISIFV